VSQWGGLRTVVPENSVTDLIDAECANYPRLEEAWEGLKWLLSRSADRTGLSSRGDDTLRLYVQSDDPLADVPALWVLYRVTDDEVQIIAVKVIPPSAGDEEE
jgi:hypothetical protein